MTSSEERCARYDLVHEPRAIRRAVGIRSRLPDGDALDDAAGSKTKIL